MKLLTSVLFILLYMFTGTVSAEKASSEKKHHMIGRDSIDFTLAEPQKLQLEVWYPAEPGEGEPDYEFYPALRTELSEVMGMPKMTLSLKSKTRGLRGLEPVKGTFPIIIFSHGFASFSRQNTRQFEALAEAGYIVLAVNHPGQSLATRFDDGSIVPLGRELLTLMTESLRTKKEIAAEASAMNVHSKKLAVSQTRDEYLANLALLKENTMYGAYPEYIFSRSKAIVDLVLNIDSIDEPSMAGADLQSIGLYGHSLGGMVSVYAAGQLSRLGTNVKSVVNLDAVQIALEDDDLQIKAPTCFIMGGSTKMGKARVSNLHVNRYLAEQNDQVCEINIARAAHHNFTDLNWVGILKWFGMLGPINNKEFGPWLTGFLVNYFDHHMKDKEYNYEMWKDAQITGQIVAR
ncbi:MAG: hypothetical protein GXP16_12930 [Gammaproteobacteria bacterium]|nr:hypothetical protein [Gammaproteobacteria bacterium]